MRAGSSGIEMAFMEARTLAAYSSKESPEKERFGTNDRKTGTRRLVLGGGCGVSWPEDSGSW